MKKERSFLLVLVSSILLLKGLSMAVISGYSGLSGGTGFPEIDEIAAWEKCIQEPNAEIAEASIPGRDMMARVVNMFMPRSKHIDLASVDEASAEKMRNDRARLREKLQNPEQRQEFREALERFNTKKQEFFDHHPEFHYIPFVLAILGGAWLLAGLAGGIRFPQTRVLVTVAVIVSLAVNIYLFVVMPKISGPVMVCKQTITAVLADDEQELSKVLSVEEYTAVMRTGAWGQLALAVLGNLLILWYFSWASVGRCLIDTRARFYKPV